MGVRIDRKVGSPTCLQYMFAKAQAAGEPFPYANHNPDFFVDLQAVPIGAKVDAIAVLSVLAKRP